ncbi:helix-turn-helix domain-containing protein [Methylocucumis oryzae]|uniref:helix-turn-helix domain-containing protein n=1 Tax=Methylocucumis oryzae TaxID=1632867 RepID=UPI000695C6A0|nr:helix-turn-helix domain-containing protein [Methylocucumis oryzae]
MLILSNFGSLRLTEQCRPILRGEQPLMLRQDVVRQTEQRTKGKAGITSTHTSLLERLKAKRREIAEAQDVPPYVILPDTSLKALADAKPVSVKKLLNIPGIGNRRAELYGEKFLAVIRDFAQAAVKDSDTIVESVNLFRLGFTAQQIAQKRELKESTVLTHLAQAIEQGSLLLTDVIDLPAKEIQQIEEALLSLSDEEKHRLKPVYEALGGAYSYEILRCVRAGLVVKMQS